MEYPNINRLHLQKKYFIFVKKIKYNNVLILKAISGFCCLHFHTIIGDFIG